MMARKRRWVWVPILLMVAVGAGFLLRREPEDNWKALTPYIVSDKVSYEGPEAASRVSAGSYGVKYRNLVLRGVSMDELLAAFDLRTPKENGWSKPHIARYEYFQYTCAKGGNFNVYERPTIQSMASPSHAKRKTITSEELRQSPVWVVESWPLTQWEAIWLRAKNWGRDPF